MGSTAPGRLRTWWSFFKSLVLGCRSWVDGRLRGAGRWSAAVGAEEGTRSPAGFFRCTPLLGDRREARRAFADLFLTLYLKTFYLTAEEKYHCPLVRLE